MKNQPLGLIMLFEYIKHCRNARYYNYYKKLIWPTLGECSMGELLTRAHILLQRLANQFAALGDLGWILITHVPGERLGLATNRCLHPSGGAYPVSGTGAVKCELHPGENEI